MVFNTYLDQFDYQRSPSGLESASLIGNSMRLNQPLVAGASTMIVTPATTVILNQFDRITIFDGTTSEVVTVGSSGVATGSTVIPISPPAVSHALGTPCCSDGTLGSLADQIVSASGWVENITKQVLWSTTQTETIRIPTMRASFDNQGILTFRTKQYPITAVNSVQIGGSQGNFVTYDPTQAFIDINEIVTVPVLNATGGASTWSIWGLADRSINAYLQVNYTAGYTSDTMPADVLDAAILLTSDLLSRRFNPVGAAEMSQGHQTAAYRLRGDGAALTSLHYLRAAFILSNYTLRAF